jgi:hypothetical protein
MRFCGSYFCITIYRENGGIRRAAIIARRFGKGKVMKQAESALSRRIVQCLNARGHCVWKNHGDRFSLRGLADISGVAKDARGIVLETKMPGKEVSELRDEQAAFLRRVIRSAPGCIVGVVSSVQDAILFVEHRELVAAEVNGRFGMYAPEIKITLDAARRGNL